MSSIDALTIQGIRSFGPDQKDRGRIKFGSPLTLILGENGCGKTTIIEALTYATCGELPSNTDRGRGFVHDPKLCNSVDTKAIVQLKLSSMNGRKLTISRPMQLTQKAKAASFQTLDCTLVVEDDSGKEVSVSRKCVDANAEVCQALGVSKAILQYVIFCHQEDSNWPLEEGKKLKERFDAIFDTTKFNKCLESIKKYVANLKIELAMKKEKLRYLTETKEEASNQRTSLSQKEASLEACKKKVANLEQELIPIQEKIADIDDKEENFARLLSEQETLKMRVKDLQSQIREYEKKITDVFKGSDDDLKKEIENFHSAVEKKKLELEEVSKQEEEVGGKMRRVREQISDERTKHGQYMRDMEANKRKIEERNKLATVLGNDLDIEADMSAVEDFQSILTSLQNKISLEKGNLSKLGNTHKSKEDEIQLKLDELREKKSNVELSIGLKNAEAEKIQKELSKVTGDILEADRSAEKVGILQMRFDRVKSSIESINNSDSISSLTKQIASDEKAKEQMEDKLSVLEKEITSLQFSSSVQAEIDVLRGNKLQKEDSLGKLKQSLEKNLLKLLKTVPERDTKPHLDRLIKNLSDDIEDKKKEIRQLEKDLSKHRMEESVLRDQLKTKKKQLEEDSKVIKEACEGEDFDEKINNLTSKLQELQDKKGTLTSSEYMFRRYVQKLREDDPCCPLCQRGFSDVEEATQLISELNLKVREVPTKLRENKESLDKTQSTYESLLQLKPTKDKLWNLENVAIPEIEGKLSKIESQIEQSEGTLSLLQAELMEPEKDLSLARNIYTDVIMLDKYKSEIKELERDISRQESKLPPGSKRSLKEALNEQNEIRGKLQAHSRTLKQSQNQLSELNSELHRLQIEKNDIQAEQFKISSNVQRRAELSDKKSELEGLSIVIQNELEDELLPQQQDINRQFDQTTKQLKTLQAQNLKELNEYSDRFRQNEVKMNEILKAHSVVLEFERMGGAKRCSAVEASLKRLQELEEQLSFDKEDLMARKESIKDYLARQSLKERELEDNITLREKTSEQDRCQKELISMRKKLGNIDANRIAEEKRSVKMEEERIQTEKSRAEGRLSELATVIREMRATLNLDKYRNADKNYKDQFIEIKVTEKTMDDLNKYYKALDWAMIKFHKDKMQAINSIIRDLWQKIYNGNDIDWIEIKTDQEPGNAASLKRVYNYRVVQVKNGVDIDMRGRCSAGQKVLASLIIRMALAETFSANCGILALDEPTTNLDEKNIDSLSATLNEIILHHLNKKNFQLVVITHDRKFLDALAQIDQITHYYEVKRNRQGKSEILKVVVRM